MCVILFMAGMSAGIFGFHTKQVRVSVPDKRPVISNHATFAQVVANLDGKKPAGLGQYLAGFQCAAWSNGNKQTDHGWVVYYCVK